MFCTNCGQACADNAAFCTNCGKKLTVNAVRPTSAQPAAPVPPAVPQPPRPVTQPAQPIAAGDPIQALKRVATSPTYLTAAIALSAAALFAFLQTILNHTNALDALYDLLYALDLEYLLSDVYYYGYDAVSAGTVIVTLISMIPALLVIAGVWMIFTAARDPYSNCMSTSGLSLLKVMQIIGLVGMCVAALAMVVVCVIIIGVVSQYRDAGPIVAVILFVMILFAALMALMIVYEIKIIQSIDAARTTIATGVVSGKISGFVGVMAIVFGGFAALSGLGQLFTSVYAGLSSLGGATASIAFGMVLFAAKNELQNAGIAVPATAGDHYQPAVQSADTPYTYQYDKEPLAPPAPAAPEVPAWEIKSESKDPWDIKDGE